jgi:chromosome segregation ATPase
MFVLLCWTSFADFYFRFSFLFFFPTLQKPTTLARPQPKALDRLSQMMKALVALRRVVSDRLVRERFAEKEARSTSDAKLIELSGKHSALVRTSASQQEKIARMEADAEALRSAETRLRERVAQLEAQNIADREASAALREQVAKDSANEAAASVTAELEERLKRSEEDLSRMQGEVEDGQKELARARADFAEAEMSASRLKEALGEEEGKASAALAEVENLKVTLAEAEAKAEESEESGGRADALAQEVLALQAGYELLESRAKSLATDLEKKQAEVNALASQAEKSKLLEKKLEEAEEEFHMAVEVLTEERDAARQKEEEYFEEMKGTENDLAHIQSGYVDLSDRLNDKTDQIFEVQEQLDAERAKLEMVTEQLMQAQKDLLTSTQQVASLEQRQQQQQQQQQQQGTPVDATKEKHEHAAPAAAASAQLSVGEGSIDAAVAAREAELAEELRQRDQLIHSLQQQIEEGRERDALAGANNILVEAAGETAAESSRQIDEAMETIESLREDLDDARSKASERKRDLEQALRERDRAVDEASREADRRVQQAVDDARRAQRELAESREEQEDMAEKLAAAERAKKVAEDAFASVSAAPVGDDMDFDAMHFDNTAKKKGHAPKSAARGGGARAARSLAQSSSRYSPRDDLDNSYGADGFDSDYGDDFDD